MEEREERWKDEVELVQAMCADDEFQQGPTANSVVLKLGTMEIFASLTEEGKTNVSLRGNKETEEIVRKILDENRNEICLVQIVQALSDLSSEVSDLSSDVSQELKTRLSTVVLRIDHMNDRKSYIRRIEKWLRERNIVGDIMFRKDGKRAKNIVCALHGEKKHLDDFLRLLRTQKLTRVDVTEKQSKILWQNEDHEMDVPSDKLLFHSYSNWSELESLWDGVSNVFRGPSFSESFLLN